jgi:membrane-bound ClpP family serine protease
MRRSYAFWGAACIVLGAALLAQEQLQVLPNLGLIERVLLGVGIILLGLAFVVTRHLLQVVLSLLAGACLGLYVRAAIADGQDTWHLVRISCTRHDAPVVHEEESEHDEDRPTSDDSAAAAQSAKDTPSSHWRVDTAMSKPVY